MPALICINDELHEVSLATTPFPARIRFDDPLVSELRAVIADKTLCPDQLLNEVLRVIHDDRVREYQDRVSSRGVS